MNVRFIVTGHGRSGTKWLANVLHRDPDVVVHHEPLTGYDKSCYWAIRAGRLSGRAFAEGRRERMARIWSRFPEKAYAEVNSFLRYCVPALREEFGAPVGAIVRDGRLVVRSMLKRGIYQSDNYPLIQSPVDLVTPFEKCCWYWADTYDRLLLQGVPMFRLERLNSDFGYFSRVCEMLGVFVQHEDWRKRAGKPKNVDVGDVPLDWSDWEYERFDLIAGGIQRRLGYEV